MTSAESSTKPERPSPTRDALSAPFFDGTAQGTFMIKRCNQCGYFALSVGTMCPNCPGSMEWVAASGQATVFTWTRVHQLGHPGLADEIPYLCGLVKLQEGPVVMAKFQGLEASDMKVGMPVQADYMLCPNGEYLPVFKRVQ